MKLFFIGLFLFIGNAQMQAQSAKDIVPKPVSMQELGGDKMMLKNASSIYYPAEYVQQANYLKEQINQQTHLKLTIQTSQNTSTAIIIQKDNSLQIPEQYQLFISPTSVLIKVNSARGLINASQSFLQLLPYGVQSSIALSPIKINDFPRFSYRGMHLDVVRHIFPVSYIKKYIDYLTFHKFNTFHWHLTDDQGWRIEMNQYKKLNTIGSWRNETLIGHFKDTPAKYDNTRYGGYYTKAEIKQIIEYASIRAITVIPEIDIPGHSRAVIAAYPELSTKPDTSWNVATTWGMYNRQNNVLAPKPATFQFLETVFSELIDLFPSKYIHIGGDECSKLWWKQDPVTQAFMKEKNINNETGLQTYFIEFIARYLQSKGRKAIGWHEINEGELDTSTIVMNWGADKQAIEAASKGFNVIMTPGKPFYFDHYQSGDSSDSLAIHGYNPTEAVYVYEPIPATISSKGLSNKIIGGQANVWTEYMGNEKKVDYMIFPRMTALSESLWTAPEQKSYVDFLNRLEKTAIPRYQYWNSSWFKNYAKWGTNAVLLNTK